MSFNPKDHLMKLKGKDYLPVAARLVWLNDQEGIFTIQTDPIQLEDTHAIFKATIVITSKDGNERIATAHKREDKTHFPDFVEKAETGAIGRALGILGFGTQFAPEFDETDTLPETPRGEPRVVDSPQQQRDRTTGITQPTVRVQSPVEAAPAVSAVPMARGNTLVDEIEPLVRMVKENGWGHDIKSVAYPGMPSLLKACGVGKWRSPVETQERLVAFRDELKKVIEDNAE